MQRHIEQAHDAAAAVQVMGQVGQVRAPVFAHGPQLAAALRPQRFEPVGEEGETDVLDRVEAEPVHAGFLEIPRAPAVELFDNGGVLHIQVCAHQIVIVAVLVVHFAFPVFAVEVEHSLALGPVVPVHTVKMGVVPLKSGVFAAAPREGEAGPGRDGALDAAVLQAVVRVAALGFYRFAAIRAHAVVQHNVRQHFQPGFLQRAHGGQVLVFCSVLGRHRSLLVKLAQVIGIVHAVAHILAPLRALVGGRQPYAGKPGAAQAGGFGRRPLPVARIRGQIPLKILDQCFRSRFHSFLLLLPVCVSFIYRALSYCIRRQDVKSPAAAPFTSSRTAPFAPAGG